MEEGPLDFIVPVPHLRLSNSPYFGELKSFRVANYLIYYLQAWSEAGVPYGLIIGHPVNARFYPVPGKENLPRPGEKVQIQPISEYNPELREYLKDRLRDPRFGPMVEGERINFFK